MKRVLWIMVPLIVMAVLVVTLLHRSRELNQRTREVDALKFELLKARKAPAPKPVRVRAVEPEQPAAQVATARPEPPAMPAAAPALPQPPAAGTNLMGMLSGMMKNPQMREFMRAQQKVMVDQMYAALPRYLNLSGEMKERLDKLLLERQQAMAEAGLTLMSSPAEDRAKAAEDAKAAKAEWDQQIRELLGDADYEVLTQYEASVPEQTQVNMFKGTLSGDEALSEKQEYDLVSAMYLTRKDLPADSLMNHQGSAPDPSQLTPERMASTLQEVERLQARYAEKAATILNPAQLERYKQWQQQMAGMQRAGLGMAAQMFGQGGAGSAGAHK